MPSHHFQIVFTTNCYKPRCALFQVNGLCARLLRAVNYTGRIMYYLIVPINVISKFHSCFNSVIYTSRTVSQSFGHDAAIITILKTIRELSQIHFPGRSKEYCSVPMERLRNVEIKKGL